MVEATIYDGEKLRSRSSLDLYDCALNSDDDIFRRFVLFILKERQEWDLIFSLAINFA